MRKALPARGETSKPSESNRRPKTEGKKLEERLRVAETGNEIGRRVTVQEHKEGEQCLVVGDSIIRNVGTGQNNMMVECFPGMKTEQLHRVLNNRDLGTPDTI
jgi:hypothetical protein